MEGTIVISPGKEKFLQLAEQHTNLVRSQHAIEALHQLEFPTTRSEDWRYTRTARIGSENWKLSSSNAKPQVGTFRIQDLHEYLIVIVDGQFRPELSDKLDMDGVAITTSNSSTDTKKSYQNIFQAFGEALPTTILELSVGANQNISRSLHFVHITTEDNVLAQPTIRVTAGKSSCIHIVESFVTIGDHRAFTNRTLEVKVDRNAEVLYDKIQQESDSHYLINDESVHIEADGRFTINTLTLDGGWVRNNLHISLDGQNIEANLHGAYLPRRKQHIDNHTLIDHRYPHCNSNELYKGLLDEHSTGVFNGKVFVQQDAQKTNAFQSNANILMSDDAQMNTKPELEIYADDVKCSHGSTTGQLDENAMFYLKARGLSEDNARRLLTSAFINDVLNKVTNVAVRNHVTTILVNKGLLIA